MAVDVSFLDTSQHDHIPDTVRLERVNQLVELADLHPVDPIDMLLKLWFRFALVGYRKDLKAHLAGIIREYDRKSPIAGDHTDSTVWNGKGRRHSHRFLHLLIVFTL